MWSRNGTSDAKQVGRGGISTLPGQSPEERGVELRRRAADTAPAHEVTSLHQRSRISISRIASRPIAATKITSPRQRASWIAPISPWHNQITIHERDMGREKLGEAERDLLSGGKDRHASQCTKTPTQNHV